MKNKMMRGTIVVLVIVAVASAVYLSNYNENSSNLNRAFENPPLQPTTETSCILAGDGFCLYCSNLASNPCEGSSGDGGLQGLPQAIESAERKCYKKKNECMRAQQSEEDANRETCQFDEGSPTGCIFSSAPVDPWNGCALSNCKYYTPGQVCEFPASSITQLSSTQGGGYIVTGPGSCTLSPSIIGNYWKCQYSGGIIDINHYKCEELPHD